MMAPPCYPLAAAAKESACNNARAMVRIRSDGRTVGAAFVSVGAVAAGLMALTLTAQMVAPAFGLRPALVAAEIALVTPGLLAAALFGGLGGLLGRRRIDRALVARALACGAALWFLSLGLMDLQARFWPPPAGYLEAFRSLHAQLRPAGPADALLSVAVIALMPALCEELVFRGLVLPAFTAVGGVATGLAVSSLLFGAIHIDPVGSGFTAYRVPFAILVGLGFGLLRLRSGTLAAPVLAHAALNTLTFAAVPLLDDPGQPVQETTLPNPVMAAVVGAVGGVALWRLLRGLVPVVPAEGPPSETDSR